MRTLRLRREILVPLALTTGMLLAVFLVVFSFLQERHVAGMAAAGLSDAKGAFEMQVQGEADAMERILRVIDFDRRLNGGAGRKGREEILLRLPLPGPREWGNEEGGQPEGEGAFIRELGLGPEGLTLLVGAPGHERGQATGYREWEEDLGHLLQRLHAVFGVEVFVLLEKNGLDWQAWEASVGRARWDRFPSAVMVDATSSLFPDELANLVSGGEPAPQARDRQVLFRGRYLQWADLPLTDRKGRVVGAVVATRDITGMREEMFASLVEAAGMCLFTGISLFALFWHLVDRAERRLKKAEQEVEARAVTDDLTGLYNRRGFLTLAEQQLKVARRSGNVMFLLYADLDDLKGINDNLGHSTGDAAIIEAADALREVFREADIVGRLGGDEFAVLAVGGAATDPDTLEARLQDRIDERNSVENRSYRLSMSVGIARNDPRDSSSIEDLISFADALMYREKNRKRHRPAARRQ